MAWDNTKPADNRKWDLAAGDIRDNNDALEAVLGVDLDTSTVGITVADIITKSPWHDVRAYGAVGDGITNDATAIQDAIDAAELTGGTVYFPAQTLEYMTDTQLSISDAISVSGVGATIKQIDSSNIASVLSVTVGSTDNLAIRINIDGNMANNAAVNGILISGVQVAATDIYVGIKNCDNGAVIEGNTETNVFNFYVTGCTIGVLERYVSGTSDPDENTYFISGHSNATHYKKSVAATRKITSIVHLSCEAATAEAVNITTVDSTSMTVLNGEIRGCASHGVIINDPSGDVRFNNLLIEGSDVASTWGIRIDDIGTMAGDVRIGNFAGGAWIRQCGAGASLQIHTSALDGTESGVQLGDSVGGTEASRFTITPGSYINASLGTTAVLFDEADYCVAYLDFVFGSTNDVVMDNSSNNNVVYANGKNITYSKYVDLTDSNRDNRFVFNGEYISTFTDTDTTPSVLGFSTWMTGTTAMLGGSKITQFDNGYAGQHITIISKGDIDFDTSSASRLIGSSVDITTAAGDTTTWVCEISGTVSSVWRLTGFVDISQNNSSTAEGIYGN